MDIEELVTKFTADVSDYRKEMQNIKSDLQSVSGITEEVKESMKKALSSSSAETQKLGKQLQSLTDKQNKNIQSAIDSGKKVADLREKSRLLVSQLNAQKAEMDKCRDALKKLNIQYEEQKNFLADYDGGMDGIRKQRQEMIDYIHGMEEAGKSAYKTEEAEKYRSAVNRITNDLKIFDNELKSVGLNPNNLKSDTLKNLEQQMQKLSRQEREYRESSQRTEAQIRSTNQSIAIEESRYSDLHSKLEQNSSSVRSLSSRLNTLSRNSASQKLKNGFNGLKTVFSRMGSTATGAFNKVKNGISKISNATKSANSSMLNTVKSIRRIGIVSLGLRVCQSIFGELRSIVTDYLSKNEELNGRVEALKTAFGNALAPAISVVVGLFEKLMPYMVSVANAISNLFTSLGLASSISATATAINDTTDATEGLSEAQNDLYGFDQITKQSDNSSESDSSAGSAAIPAKSFGNVESIGEKIAASCNSVISKLNALDWGGIQKKVNDAVGSIANSLNGFVYNFDWYGAGQLVGNGINTIFGAIDTFLTTFDFKALGAGIADNFNGLFDTVDFGQIGKTLSDGIAGAFDLLSGFLETLDWQQVARSVEDFVKGIDWSRMTSSLFESIGAAIGGLSALLGTWIVDAVNGVQTFFGEKIEECGGNIGEGILTGILEIWQNISTWVQENIFEPFITGFKNAFGIASPSKVMKTQGKYIIDGLFDGIGNIWSRVKTKFNEFKTNVTNFFTGKDGLQSKIKNLGSSLVTKLTEGMSNLKSKLTSVFRDPLNGVIGLINRMIGRINGYLNISVNSTLASVLNALGIGVSAGSYKLFTIPNIPMLAGGGIVEQPTLAMVGERGREAVVPLENNTGWIAQIAKLIVEYSNAVSNNNGGDIIIPIQLGDERIMLRVDRRSVQTKDKFARSNVTA